MSMEDTLAELEAEGWYLVQRGTIGDPTGGERHRPERSTFADRANGCDVSKIASGDRIIEHDREWAHLKRGALTGVVTPATSTAKEDA